MEKRILLIPLGPVCEELPGWLESRIAEIYSAQVSTGELVALPETLFVPQRKQYDGDLILPFIRNAVHDFSEYKLGLVDEDCFSEGLNFIFGQSVLKGHESFVALSRLKESFYARAENKELFFQRVLKEAVHELGHAFGMVHCADPECVMHFSNSLKDTDRKTLSLCGGCRRQLWNTG
ncbi:MAG: archaemetzincin family Zn-dependent metalloprotease [Chitinispirillaceae bacterium]